MTAPTAVLPVVGVTVGPTGVVVLALVVGSVAFSVVAVVGFARLPDVFARAHAASKSETLGALCGLAAAGLAFGTGAELLKIGLLALFVLVTGPTAAHAVVRAAGLAGATPWTRPTPDGVEPAPDRDPVADGGTDAGTDGRDGRW